MAAKHKKDKKTDKSQGSSKKRPKLVRDSFTMPEDDYGKIKQLKSRCMKLGLEAKKSELLRAGLFALESLQDTEFKSIVVKIEKVKTGRPPN
jgi:hypothetical protein